MNSHVSRDMANSSYDFERAVWPAISVHLGGGELVKNEGVGTRASDALDMNSGIDWIQKLPNGTRMIASRVQWLPPGRSGYRSFTIRSSRASGNLTELAKRNDAIRDDMALPQITIQAYIRKPERIGQLLSVACINTKDLMLFVRTNPSRCDKRTNVDGSSSFIIAYWSDIDVDSLWVHPEYGDIESPEERAATEEKQRKAKAAWGKKQATRNEQQTFGFTPEGANSI